VAALWGHVVGAGDDELPDAVHLEEPARFRGVDSVELLRAVGASVDEDVVGTAGVAD
jgi:hypothetical protein